MALVTTEVTLLILFELENLACGGFRELNGLETYYRHIDDTYITGAGGRGGDQGDL